jgi:ABC-2 type transport system permease protein
MSTPTDTAPATRPLYWSVRRELWENRSIVFAPLAVAVVVLFGFLISTIGMPERRRAALLLDEAHRQAAIEAPYDVAAMMLLLTAFIVGVFYCLDALYGERRDRSILFWKSLPVPDLATVLAKASIPLVILPLITFVVAVTTQFLMMLLSTAVLLPSGLGGSTWAQLPFFQIWLVLPYGLLTVALWHAPIYAWLLLVSGWVRRAAFLWAVLPLFAIGVLEKIAFNTTYFALLLRYRLIGGFTQAFVIPAKGSVPAGGPLTQITPWKFLSTPGLWIGLAFAAAFLAAAVRLRRSRGPI